MDKVRKKEADVLAFGSTAWCNVGSNAVCTLVAVLGRIP